MVTGRIHSRFTVVVVRRAKGVSEQTRAPVHHLSCSGFRTWCVCVNKMDRGAYDEAVFEAIVEELHNGRALRRSATSPSPDIGGARRKVVEPPESLQWTEDRRCSYNLEHVVIAPTTATSPTVLVITWVRAVGDPTDERLAHDYRAREEGRGRILRQGRSEFVATWGRQDPDRAIEPFAEKGRAAFPTMSVTVRLRDDLGRLPRRHDRPGPKGIRPRRHGQLEAMLCWLGEQQLRQRVARRNTHTTRTARAGFVEEASKPPRNVTPPSGYRRRAGADNEIGSGCGCERGGPLLICRYSRKRTTGLASFQDPGTTALSGPEGRNRQQNSRC